MKHLHGDFYIIDEVFFLDGREGEATSGVSIRRMRGKDIAGITQLDHEKYTGISIILLRDGDEFYIKANMSLIQHLLLSEKKKCKKRKSGAGERK